MSDSQEPVTIPDVAIRAITDDGSFRVIVVHAPTLVNEAGAAQGTVGTNLHAYGELLIGTTLIRQTMSPAHRVQAVIQCQGTTRLVADSLPDGITRGLATLEEPFELGPETTLEVIRTVHGGRLHRSIIDVSDATNQSHAMMTYLQSSEQVVSIIAVDVTGVEGKALAAGGYIVQLLPEASDGLLAVMTERLASFPNPTELLLAGGPQHLLSELLYGIPYTVLEEPPIRFGCNCSLERVVGALATLGRDEINKLIAEDRVLELSCDYCGMEYPVAPAQLKGLVDLN